MFLAVAQTLAEDGTVGEVRPIIDNPGRRSDAGCGEVIGQQGIVRTVKPVGNWTELSRFGSISDRPSPKKKIKFTLFF
ncbi:hypothetical protein VTK26DRAFT_7352 [Humicola hyalothermophila]